jgi:hypothetical protein
MATRITGTVSGEPIIEYEVGGVFVPYLKFPDGLQNWATVTAVTGTPTEHSYTDGDGVSWVAYEWSSNGSVTVTDGLADILIVSAGSVWAFPNNGSGGQMLDGLHEFSAGSHTVTVGATGTDGQSSHLGPYFTAGTHAPYSGFGAGQGWVTGGADRTIGKASSITGTSVTYSPGRNGSSSPTGVPGGMGTAGRVILRVPSTYAQA